jgi:hypothetical protein
LGPDTLRIVATGFRQRNVDVPIDSVSTLEVGHKSKTWILPGAVAGFALGYGVAYLLSDNSEAPCWLFRDLTCEVDNKNGNGYWAGLIGALVGAGIGWTLGPDRWRARLSVSLAVP